MTVYACRFANWSRQARRPTVIMRTTTLSLMEDWLGATEPARRRYRKTVWLEREGQPAHTLAVGPSRKRGRPYRR